MEQIIEIAAQICRWFVRVIVALAYGVRGAVAGGIFAFIICLVIFFVWVTYNSFNGLYPLSQNTTAVARGTLHIFWWLLGILGVLGFVVGFLENLTRR